MNLKKAQNIQLDYFLRDIRSKANCGYSSITTEEDVSDAVINQLLVRGFNVSKESAAKYGAVVKVVKVSW